MQANYKLLTNHSPLQENDDSSKPVPGYDPGRTLGTGDQEPHKGTLREYLDTRLKKGYIRVSKSPCLSPLLFVKKKGG
ncbi:hypothetical protein DSO57_1001574 [Entomophthora muscae]|uniref:Uncharacterized protein n=1 Tax=Entomophthora muscae TaxID=34485 RepID=A0ACC2SB49_9FUNG|nr:hypothetical protein DSO57_1001574 [Entomophthora muscae]